MASLKERVTARVDRAREKWPLLDHLVRTVQHYSKVNANALAGAVTYFGFLSFFPILALAFFFVGQLSKVYDEARSDRVCELNVRAQVLSLSHAPVLRDAWDRGQPLSVHGWLYRLSDGRLRDLRCGASGDGGETGGP